MGAVEVRESEDEPLAFSIAGVSINFLFCFYYINSLGNSINLDGMKIK